MIDKSIKKNKFYDQSERLKQIRKSRGFSSALKACEENGWNYNSYIQHELGLRSLARSAKKYADGYKVSQAWLLTGEGESPSLAKNDEELMLEQEFRRFLLDSDQDDQKILLRFLKSFSVPKKK
ncbi:XRE family transcriptional regulator [Bartonella sp. DGB1]|uniref:XRE family transcriptional regulator n=1 Tax=Bartonella sp. DGB1 TaxID=3239807 RepID=UPI003525BD64